MSKRNRKRRSAQNNTPAAVKAGDSYGTFWGPGTSGAWMGGGVVGRNTNLSRTEWGAATAYQIMPEVNRAMNLRADAIGSLPWEVVKLDANGKEIVLASSEDVIPRHPLAKAFADTYHYANKSLLALMCYSHDLGGEVFVQKTFTPEFGRSLFWLNPLGTEPIISSGEILNFQYTSLTGGISEVLQPKEVAYYHTWNPYNDHRGQGLTQVVMQKINMARNLDDFIEDFFGNNARPSVIISPTGDEIFTKEQKTQLQQQTDVFLRGRGNQWSTYVAPINAKYEPLDQPKIGEHYTIAPELSQYIYTVYGVPKALAGDDSGTQYKTGDDVKVAFFQITIIPLATHFERYINSSIMPYLDGSGAFFRFDTTEFDLVSDDDKMRMDIATAAYTSGIWTRNKASEYTKTDKLGDTDFLQIEGIPVPLHEVGQYWKYKLTVRPAPEVAAPVSQELGVTTATDTPQITGSADTTASRNEQPQVITSGQSKAVTSDSAFVYIPLPNNQQLASIQNQLKPLLGKGVEYQDPATFHVTLLYCNSISDHDLQEVADWDIGFNGVNITGSKLGLFNNADEHALHLVVDLVYPLTGLQKTIYDHFAQSGFSKELSPFSTPSAYTAHITLAYLPKEIRLPLLNVVFNAPAATVVYGRDEYKPFAVVTSAPMLISGKATQATVDGELDAWRKVATKNYNKSLKFEAIHLRGDLGDWITDALAASGGDGDTVKAVFATARERLATKAIQSTRLEFEGEFDDLLARAQADRVDRRTFSASLRYFLNKFGKMAYVDGLKDGGVDTTELDEEDRGKIAEFLAEQSQYVSEFSAVLFKGDGISTEQAVGKSSMWWNKSVEPAYQAGLVSADRNGLYEWVYGDTEHCDSCLKLNGQRHRLRDYQRKGILPKSDGLDCGGYNCKCQIVKATGRARGQWI